MSNVSEGLAQCCYGNKRIERSGVKIKNKATYSIKNGIHFQKISTMLLFEIAGIFWNQNTP
jgi:hypothetical protein